MAIVEYNRIDCKNIYKHFLIITEVEPSSLWAWVKNIVELSKRGRCVHTGTAYQFSCKKLISKTYLPRGFGLVETKKVTCLIKFQKPKIYNMSKKLTVQNGKSDCK